MSMFRRLAWGALVLPAGAALAEPSRPPAVVATITPVHSIAAAVMDGVGVPALLVPGASSPHTFALKPSAARAVQQAQVLVRVGPEVEPFTERLVASLPAGVMVVTVTQVPGMRLLPVREGAGFEPHLHHDHDTHGAHDDKGKHAGHGQTSAADHGHSVDGRIDGHVWLDPGNARALARHLAGVLGRIHPEKASEFSANAARFEAAVTAVSSEIETRLASLKGRPFITFHDAYHYFEHRFDVFAAGSIMLSPEIPMGARRISEVRAAIARHGEVCIFGEPQHPTKLLEAVAADTSARIGALDPIGGDIPPGPGHYVAMLRKLSVDMASCLAGLKVKERS